MQVRDKTSVTIDISVEAGAGEDLEVDILEDKNQEPRIEAGKVVETGLPPLDTLGRVAKVLRNEEAMAFQRVRPGTSTTFEVEPGDSILLTRNGNKRVHVHQLGEHQFLVTRDELKRVIGMVAELKPDALQLLLKLIEPAEFSMELLRFAIEQAREGVEPDEPDEERYARFAREALQRSGGENNILHSMAKSIDEASKRDPLEPPSFDE